MQAEVEAEVEEGVTNMRMWKNLRRKSLILAKQNLKKEPAITLKWRMFALS